MLPGCKDRIVSVGASRADRDPDNGSSRYDRCTWRAPYPRDRARAEIVIKHCVIASHSDGELRDG